MCGEGMPYRGLGDFSGVPWRGAYVCAKKGCPRKRGASERVFEKLTVGWRMRRFGVVRDGAMPWTRKL